MLTSVRTINQFTMYSNFEDIVLIKIEPSFKIKIKQLNNCFNRCLSLVYLRLNLFDQCKTDQDAVDLFNSFNQSKNITHLEINIQTVNPFRECISDSGILKLAETLCSLLNIQFLNLAISQFLLGSTVSCLGKAISKLTKMKNLILDFGHHPHDDLTIEIDQSEEHDNGFIQCFKEMSKCSQLKTIQLCLEQLFNFIQYNNYKTNIAILIQSQKYAIQSINVQILPLFNIQAMNLTCIKANFFEELIEYYLINLIYQI
ncbi:hypothetical protein ABPG72_002603 [Tetrahymena utriculariae]